MAYQLCLSCQQKGYCQNTTARLVSDAQLNNPEYIRDLKNFMRRMMVSDSEWREFLNDIYRDYPGWIHDAKGEQVFLNMEEFERPYIREWFRDFLLPCADTVQPRVRCEARERVRILATIMSAVHPISAFGWGLRAANDNECQRDT